MSETDDTPPRGRSSDLPPPLGGGEGAPESEDRTHRFRGPGVEAIPESLRRLLEAGLGRLGDRPELLKQRLAELKLPREAWSAILAQLDDRKSGLYRLVAKEVRDLLENTNFAEELVKALTTLSFEMKTEIRFIPNDRGGARPSVHSKVKVKPTTRSSEHSDTGEVTDRSRNREEENSVAPSDTVATRATPEDS